MFRSPQDIAAIFLVDRHFLKKKQFFFSWENMIDDDQVAIDIDIE